MNKKFVNAYIKYTAKTPILFFTMIIVGVLSIILLSLTTKTNIVVSTDATLEDNAVIVDGIFDTNTGFIYIYTNRNDHVFSVEISETVHSDSITIFYLDKNDLFANIIQRDIGVDIPIREITIFERVFLRGGRINE